MTDCGGKHGFMETVTIRKAKADLSRLIQRACRGEEVPSSLAGRSRLCAWSRFGTRTETASREL